MKPSFRSIVFGASAAIAAGSALLLGAGAGAGAAGCNAQELAPQPDAAPAKCNPGPFLFGCTPTTTAEPHCSSDDRSSTYLARLPPGTSYPVGCGINYVGERDLVGGDCKLEQVCKCILPDLVVPPATDAGDDDGGAVAPAPTGAGAPVWRCG